MVDLECRNHIIFHQETFDEYVCLELFRYHFVWWVRKAIGDVVPTFSDISRCPSSVTSPPRWISLHYHISLSPLVVVTIMVNTDVFFTTSNSQDGIGGIFHDDQGNPLALQLLLGPTMPILFSNQTLPMLYFDSHSRPKCLGTSKTPLARF